MQIAKLFGLADLFQYWNRIQRVLLTETNPNHVGYRLLQRLCFHRSNELGAEHLFSPNKSTDVELRKRTIPPNARLFLFH
jgi:hypothetical protein